MCCGKLEELSSPDDDENSGHPSAVAPQDRNVCDLA